MSSAEFLKFVSTFRSDRTVTISHHATTTGRARKARGLKDFDCLLKLSVAALERADLGGSRRRNTVAITVVGLLLRNPVTQSLGGHSQPLGWIPP